MTAETTPTAHHTESSRFRPEWAVFAAAVLARLPVLGAWWCRDDWGLLARGAGLLDPQAGMPVRWLSQHLYWQIMWPLCGLEAGPHAAIRLCLHGLAAVLVLRIGRRCGLGAAGATAAGLIFAASPLAFVPLYWAAGIQELLAAVLALFAVERWLAGTVRGRGALVAAGAAAVGSMLAKESGLGLPLLFAGFILTGTGLRPADRRFAWGMTAVLAGMAALTGYLALKHFATGPGDPYDLGGLGVAAVNLGIVGWWLLSPGPVLAGSLPWPLIVGGGLLPLSWGAWGLVQWRRGRRLPLVALVAALLAIAPVLPLRQHIAPYMVYLAGAAWAMALGAMISPRMRVSNRLLVAGMVAAAAWGFFGTRTLLRERNEMGLPANDLVRATSLSWEACDMLRGITHLGGGAPVTAVTILQIPFGPAAIENADRFGERWAKRTDLHEALGGALGPRLILGRAVDVRWSSGLLTAPDSAVVFAATPTGLRFWGRTDQAALHAALAEIGLGNFARARRHLLRAAGLGGASIGFICDEGQMTVPMSLVLARREEFVDWTLSLMTSGASATEVGGLQEMFFDLLSACTGRSVDDLTQGSRLIAPATDRSGSLADEK